MRKVLLSGIITASLALFAACGQQASTEAVASEEVSTEVVAASVELSVDGMMCSHGCVSTIEKALGNTEGVSYASVNFDESSAKVEFDSEEISEDEIIEVINGLHDGIYTAKLASWDGSEEEAVEGESKKNCDPSKCDPSKCTSEMKEACVKAGKTDCAKACSAKMKEA